MKNNIQMEEIYDGLEILHKPSGGVIRFSITQPAISDAVPTLRVYFNNEKFLESVYFEYYKTYEGIRTLAHLIEERVLCIIDESVVQHLLQRHIMFRWLEIDVEERGDMFLLKWDICNDLPNSIKNILSKDFPELERCSNYYQWYIIELVVKNESEFLPDHFETTFRHGKWLHLSRKKCSVHEIRDEYIYYIRKFLLSVVGVEDK